MAIDIFDQDFSDQVVFDRIVDCDRTITLARQAAQKAEANGQLDKAAKLRERADQLEQILKNTKNPSSSEESGIDSDLEQEEGKEAEDVEASEPEETDAEETNVKETDTKETGEEEEEESNQTEDSKDKDTGQPSESSKDNSSQKTGKSKEFDPFKVSFGGSGAGEQVTPEEELEAIIKKLSSLKGEAKKGADRGLQDFYNLISGGDSL